MDLAQICGKCPLYNPIAKAIPPCLTYQANRTELPVRKEVSFHFIIQINIIMCLTPTPTTVLNSNSEMQRDRRLGGRGNLTRSLCLVELRRCSPETFSQERGFPKLFLDLTTGGFCVPEPRSFKRFEMRKKCVICKVTEKQL